MTKQITPRSYILAFALFSLTLITYLATPSGYIKDFIGSFIFISVLALLYHKLKLTPITFSLITASLILHNLGAFGSYGKAPLGIPYDNITHFFGIFVASLALSNLFSGFLSRKKKNTFANILILGLIVLSALGVGSIVENAEFVGYLIWGEGEGFFEFGVGDYVELANPDLLLSRVGGGYFDAMEDLIANLIGALTGTLIFAVSFFILKRDRI